ncbi:hypothetical protein CBR_g9052 [Chara braunii]|uniref:Uncharacterized protein n=1 Tax=Chara braunii TaxID=69332 RepID=A0A388KNK1_CHABU|nr:hypothetical protein CBR_g9052 [Chara braunii]|eukprot:GBG71636.1 hypothetical protein CBR_g9052 [Chara braunii]
MVRHQRECQEDNASFLSRCFFMWVTDLIKLANRKTLETCDLWDLRKGDDTQTVTRSLEKQWYEQQKNPRPSIAAVIWKTCWKPFLSACILKLLSDACQLSSPVLVQKIINLVQAKNTSRSVGLSYGALFLSISIAQTVTVHIYYQMLYRITSRVRASMVCLVYKKATRISTAESKGASTGEIMNLQSNDVEKVRNAVLYINYLWDGPLQIFVALAMLVNIIGPWPAVSGFAVLVLMIPAQAFVMSWLSSVRMKLITHTDERVKLITEIIQGIKAVKLYAGEEQFIEQVNKIREKELQHIWKTRCIDVLSSFAWGLGPTLVSLMSFGVYTILGNQLTAEVAFPALTLFNLIRFPLVAIPYQINSLVQANVSTRRLEKFLALPELIPVQSSTFDSTTGSITVTEADFTWHPAESDNVAPPTLSKINLQVSPGHLVIVIGEVGAGKSSLLAAILGEMRKLSLGSYVSVSGSMAYTAQDPWIQNATVQENILMGNQLDEEKYNQVINACALVEDLGMLQGGDQAEIGEKGINLSGGQKHRVALARAVYASADIYLLDDPLSAVDTHVGRHLFDHCICGLLAQKTRILVTHQLQFVDAADAIVVMQQGTITDVGTYLELRQRGINFAMFEEHEDGSHADSAANPSLGQTSDQLWQSTSELSLSGLDALYVPDSAGSPKSSQTYLHQTSLNQSNPVYEGEDRPAGMPTNHTGRMGWHGNHGQGSGKDKWTGQSDGVEDAGSKAPNDDASDVEEEKEEAVGQGLNAPLLTAKGKERSHSRKSERRQGSGEVEVNRQVGKEVDREKKRVKGMLVKSEHRSEGNVQREVYLKYIRAWGRWYWVPVLVLVAYVIAQSVKLANDSWLAVWSGNIKEHPDADQYYLRVYGITAGVAMVLVTARWVILSFGVWNAARNLHMQLLEHCMRLPMSFFDTQPTGRLTNRFTKDTEQMDLALPNTIESYLECFFQTIFALLLIVIITRAFILPLILLVWLYKRIEAYYLHASRELKRLDALLHSPIFSHFAETIRGLSTIRAFCKQEAFVQLNYSQVNDSSRAYLASISVNRWLGVRLELIGAALVSSVAFISFLGLGTGAGAVGLALTSALSISNVMNWMVRVSAEMETSMNSVERILEYTSLETEAPAIVPENRPPHDWPQRGTIEAVDVWVRYRPELDPVLKGLTFTVQGGEKIGACGRTGCGKSTLTMALYRIVELCRGKFFIDGIDVSKIGLKDLRSKLALVPQDPVIFSGTVRMNLDPLGDAGSDSQLWEALRKSGMAAAVSALPGKLDAEVTEAGQNFSVGQRQLLCMGRALLRNSRILVLDEATSNVDSLTDSIIQTTIRESFRHCTVLTIAHRLHTIIDSDRVLLLEKGELLEFDAPAKLLENESSMFTSFVNRTLPRESWALRRAALAKAASPPSVNAFQH